MLATVWAVVADANRYFAGEAPWAQAKTDPQRQGTMLYVTAEVLRQVAILAQPFMPIVDGEDARSTGDPGRANGPSTSLRGPPHQGGRHIAAAEAGFPALRGSRGKGLKMLVDSHCHLDFPDFASELDAVVARARAAGIGRMVTISTRVKKHAQVLAIAEKFPDVFCSVGTHPHNAAKS